MAPRAPAAGNRPDFRTVNRFRQPHLKTFGKLFVAVVQLARKMGLVKLGTVARDGTKVKANASKHQAMSYQRMREEEQQLEKEREPRTLQEAIIYFSESDNCLSFWVKRRWPKGVACPRCGSDKVGFIKSRRVWQCKNRHPQAQFSVKVGTIFEDSPIGLDKWLTAIWMIANCKNGVSSWEIHRALGVTQKTAWFMLHRVRLALQDELGGKLDGEIEIDESYIGGKVRNMHRKRARRLAVKTGRGESGKTVVMGVLERKGALRGFIVPATKRRTLRPHIDENVERGAPSPATISTPTWVGERTSRTRSSTTPRSTLMAGSIPTVWRTSGAC